MHQTNEKGLYDAIRKNCVKEFAEKLKEKIEKDINFEIALSGVSEPEPLISVDKAICYSTMSINELLKEMGCHDE